MTKKFIKDNRGQVLYAVVVTVMFVGVLSMITMGMTLKNYQNAVKKQENIRNYYAADAVVEMIRVNLDAELSEEKKVEIEEMWPGVEIFPREVTDPAPESTKTDRSEPDPMTGQVIETKVTEHYEIYLIKSGSVAITVRMKVVTTETQIFETAVGAEEPPADPPQATETVKEITRTIISWEVSYNAE